MRAARIAPALVVVACLGVLSPAPAAAQRVRQRNPTAQCRDGTFYYGAGRRGACVGHGGMAEWMARDPGAARTKRPAATVRRPRAPRPAAKPRAARPPRAGAAGAGQHSGGGAKKAGVANRAPSLATARCRDGSWWFDSNRATACQDHGGIERWLGRR